MTETEPNAWWNTLRHEGVLVSPIVLDDWLPDGPHLVEDRAVDKLRQHYYRFADDPTQLRPFLDAVLEEFLGHSKPNWRKEHDIPDRFKHQGKKPNRVLLNAGKEHQPRFIVLIDDERVADESGKPHRLGLHSGRRKHADLLRLMRATDVKLGVLTNGHHFRLVYGGMDHESWAEWSADAWFQGGDGRTALHGLFTLLGAKTLAPDSDSDKHELLVKVQESRDRQADLSHVMGTQIREAVELLMEELTDSLTHANRESILAPLHKLGRSKDEELQSLYQGAIRCIMRLIVQLYAESRALLPKQERIYYESYSVEGLYQMLKRAAADGREEELRSLRSAWPRLLASWRAIHDGSIHKDLQIQSYGGQLFRPYATNPQDTVLAAIAVLEDPRVHVSDWAIREVLEKLRIGKYKVGRGKWRKGPVDFSDLRTEYIGMMYEGLLDYDLREARQEDGGIVFLSIGDQPALPLNVLAAQQPDDIKRLLKEQSKKNKGGADAESAEEKEEADSDEDDADEPSDEPDAADDGAELEGTADEQFQANVTKWAVKAVELGALFGCTPAKLKKLDMPQRDKLLLEAAHRLVLKAIPPGGMYLVRWSGTRKGSGTFYTKPGLAVPTTVRTLEPLVYDNHEDREHRAVKRPEEILALKVCDPAMGSGSFLVAALRFLAGALKESFEKYVIPKVEAGEMKATETGETAIGLLTERILRTRHEDHSGERTESALKRAVVEHCIYGVDLNPLAVELGKLSLWIETMDPTLRFTFLDHKIKCGNSLIGAWKQQAEHYPLAAWDRDAGDGKTNPRTVRLKRLRKEIIIPELKTYLDGFKLEGVVKSRAPKNQPAFGQQSLAGGAVQLSLQSPSEQQLRAVRVATQTRMDAPDRGATWEQVLDHELAQLERIRINPDPIEQEEEYRSLVDGDGHKHQKYLLDKWCAVWFWPIKEEDGTPVAQDPVLSPREFYAATRTPAVHAAVKQVASAHRFFHWELEYPDVFGATRFGFDAVIGNPPWETNEAKTQELFVKFDPAFRTLAGQGAKNRIKELTNDASVRRQYWDYSEGFLATKNYFSSCHDFIQGLTGKEATDKWLALTQGTKALPNGEPTPYDRVKGKQNLYTLFTEHSLASSRTGGMVGLVAPSGLFSDFNTRDLREALLEGNTWEWVFCFENRRKVFPIHAQFKFAAYVVRRGGRTNRLRCRFMEHDLAAWGSSLPPSVVISLEQIKRFSPDSRSLVEVQNARDLEILEGIFARSTLIGKTDAQYAEEYNATSDSDKFWPREELIAAGYAPTPSGTWATPAGQVAYPLYEGRMVGILQFSKKGYVSGRARSAVWRPIKHSEAAVEPQFLVKATDARSVATLGKPGVSFMDVTSATNTRTTIVTLSPEFPHNDKAPRLLARDGQHACEIAACMASYVFDFVTRFRLNGTSYSWNSLAELPVCRPTENATDLVRRIQAGQSKIAPAWATIPPPEAGYSWHALIEELDEAMAIAYGLSRDDMLWILRPDNPDPRLLWKDYRERLKILEAAGHKGKWYTLEEAREIRRKAGMEVDF